MKMQSTFRTDVAVELARRGMRQRDLAGLMKIPDTTLSDWLRGQHPPPPDLAARIERALKLPTGSLAE